MTRKRAMPPRGRKHVSALDPVAKEKFLVELAQTSNVSQSARVAGLDTFHIYAARKAFKGFRDAWQRALSEGYARLEANLLSIALTETNVPNNVAPSDAGEASEGVNARQAKAKAAEQRLGVQLLTMHRAAVRGETAKQAEAVKPKTRASGGKAQLEARFLLMRNRLLADDLSTAK